MATLLGDLQVGGNTLLGDLDPALLGAKSAQDSGGISSTETVSVFRKDMYGVDADSTLTVVETVQLYSHDGKTAGDSGAFDIDGDLPVDTIGVQTLDQGIATVQETARKGLTTQDDASSFDSTETAALFAGTAQKAGVDSVNSIGSTEIAQLVTIGATAKSGTDSVSTLSSTETSILAQLEPTAEKSASDTVSVLSATDISFKQVYDTTKSASDVQAITSIENRILQKFGSSAKSANDSGSLIAIEIADVKKPKYASDLLGIFGALETTGDIVKIQYDPGWEDDDVSWGGILLGSKDTAPIFAKGNKFYILARGGANYLDGYLERRAIVAGEGRYVIGRGVYPQVIGTDGSVVQIWLGAHNSPEGAIDWEGPYDFVIGEDNFVDFAVTGKYLAVRFASSAIPAWKLQSYDIDFEVVGNN